MIYSINTEDYALYPTYKSFFAMSDEMVYNMINDDFNDLKELLRKKGIDYLKLKSALIPNQDKENNEVCLVFDTCFIDDCYYGMEIFSKLIPLFNKESTFSVLSGDYIDILYKNNSEDILHQMFEKSITIIKDSTYKYHNHFYLVYINNCCKTQFRAILDGLNDYRAFVGYAVINNSSPFKMYLSAIIKSTFIKAKKAIIMPHESDRSDEANCNILNYPFEINDFNVISINEEKYYIFLGYKIETSNPDTDDICFSINALLPQFTSLEKMEFIIYEEKWNYINQSENGKGNIMNSIKELSKEEFTELVYQQIRSNYIYRLDRNDYGALMFNVFIELPTRNGHIRKTTIALKYDPQYNKLFLTTIT